jgi:N-acyl-D-aspartate/D-glutamate deacylase
MPELDLIVRSGTVVDGTGAPPRTADIAVHAGRVVEVGKVDGSARQEIDADGAVVLPGFVDIHSHYDGQATWDAHLAPSSWHGVTTVVAGNCGVGFAPVRLEDQDALIELMEGVEEIPGVTMHEGLSWAWESFPEFLDELDRRPHDIDVGVQLPHAPLRVYVMGDRAARREPATADDIAAMARLAKEAIEAGALGFSTSRTLNHKSSTGELTPTLTAEHAELLGIALALAEAGTGVLQVVSDFLDPAEEFSMLRSLVAESGRPLSFSLGQRSERPDHWRYLLDCVTQANADGLAMRAQVAVRPIGVLLGLQCTMNPFSTNPAYRELTGLAPAERARAMRDPEVRRRILDAATGPEEQHGLGRLIDRFDEMFELGDPPDYEPDPATSIGARARRTDRSPHELAYELLVADDGGGFLYVPHANYVGGNLDVVGEMLTHPHTVPGLADGGAHMGTVCDGSFPTTLLTHWGRDRDRGRIELPEIARRHCRETARTVGLLDRGVLAPGFRADLNVIDFDGLRLHRPEMHYDLPAGAGRLLQRADGYLHTVVAGQETYRDGTPTGALPGRLVRGAQPGPA